MFKAGQTNPYDEIIAKTTDENLTGENWELILNLCDKVQEEGEQGARNVIASILKRLTHRTSNVQLYTLTLAESLTKNCGIEVHREIASRAFTQGLERLITDRNTHEKVRRRALGLIAEWTADFEKDQSLGVMEECYANLRAKGYKFDTPNEPPPPEVDDDIRRREEEELQRVLEMSMHDKGGRGQWNEYSLTSSSGAGASVAAAAASGSRATATPTPVTSSSAAARPTYGGYVPSASPALSGGPPAIPTPTRSYSTASVASATSAVTASPAPSIHSQDSGTQIVTRVRALHTFEPTEAGELAFEKGDIIKVVDRGYKDWWRGQLKGRTGIFPVNYVERLPEPTMTEIAREAEQEAAVFTQAANVDRLLTMLRQMDPAKDNLADNEEIQELYRSCMSLRPKIVKLIDKYSQKRADLVTMNETFVKARSIFDRMMEESLARHTSVGYDPRGGYGQPPYPRPDSQAQSFGWNPSIYEQPGYGAYPPPAGAYPPPGPEPGYPGAPPPSQPYVDPAAYQQSGPGAYPPQPYGAPVTPSPYGAPGPAPQVQPYGSGPAPQQVPHHGQPVSPSLDPAQPPPQQPPMQQQPPGQQPPAQQPPAYMQAPMQQPPQQPPVSANQPAAAMHQPQDQGQGQTHPQQQQQDSQPPAGPPFVYDPNIAYPDPNVQAWAQYYAQGGTDPTGAVYFISVPGVKEASPPATAPAPEHPASQSPALSSTAPLNIHHVSAQPAGATSAAAPSSPGAQHQVQQAFYQANPGSPNASSGSLSSAPGGQPVGAYGVSPYPAPGAYASPGSTSPAGDKPAWAGSYGSLPGQFAGLNVNGEGPPPSNHPGTTPGVGAPA